MKKVVTSAKEKAKKVVREQVQEKVVTPIVRHFKDQVVSPVVGFVRAFADNIEETADKRLGIENASRTKPNH